LLNNKIIISRYLDNIILCHFIGNDLCHIYRYSSSLEEDFVQGLVLNGRVEKVISGTNSAFVRINKNTSAFINGIYKCEDIFPVQLVKPAIKDKRAVVTGKITIAGRLTVVSGGFGKVKLSHKALNNNNLDIERINRLCEETDVTVILRTRALNDNVAIEAIENEIKSISQKIKYINEQCENRPVYQILYRPLHSIIEDCLDIVEDFEANEIVTDIVDLYNLIFEENESYFGSVKLSDRVNIRFYEDKLLPLSKLYAFETKISEVLSRKVYLKNGANITFDQTEALLAIDVNASGYNNKKSDLERNILEVNIAAAKEIFRQLKLRNYCGIIIIDFINMKMPESYSILKKEIDSLINADKIKTVNYGFTALGLCELSRQKKREVFYVRG